MDDNISNRMKMKCIWMRVCYGCDIVRILLLWKQIKSVEYHR